MKKKIKLIITLVFAMFVMVNVTKADTRTLKFGDRAYGPGGWNYYWMHSYKLENETASDDAYCLQMNNTLKNGDTYKLYTDANLTEKKRYVAAQIIKYVQSKTEYNAGEKVVVISAALNQYLKMNGYINFANRYGTLYGDAITGGQNLYDSLEMDFCSGTNNGTCFNNDAFKFGILSNKVEMNASGENTWISERITVSGMLSSYAGAPTKYTISVKGHDGANISGICIVPSNSNTCMTSVANGTYQYVLNSPTSSNFSFRVKVVGEANAGKSVNVSVHGTNSSTYSYINTYVSATNSTRQALAILVDRTVNRYVYRDLILNIPAPVPEVEYVNHTISARKYDDNFVSLEGADFEVRAYNKTLISEEIDDDTTQETTVNNQTFPVKNSNGSSYFKWTSNNIVKTEDNWNNYQYCLVETKVPNGYVHPSGSAKFTCVTPAAKTACYNEDNVDVGDNKYCQGASYVCPNEGTLQNGACTETVRISTNPELFTEVTNNSEYTADIYGCEGNDFELDTSGDQLSCKYTGEEDPAPTAPEPTPIRKTCIDNTKCFEYVAEGQDERKFYICPNDYDLDTENLGTCIKTIAIEASDEDNAAHGIKCAVGEDTTGSFENLKYCSSTGQYTGVSSTGVNLHFTRKNSKTNVRVCKKNITGDEELPGAKLKICTDKPDKKGNCTIEKVDSFDEEGKRTKVDVSWVTTKLSNDDACGRIISGLTTNKTYYLVEEIAPLGYKISTAVEFSLDEAGNLIVGGKTSSTGELVINDDLTNFSISKSDMATTKELPGAELKICLAGLDENGEYQMAVDRDGNCIVPLLHDGTEAKWTSGEEPHEVVGLPAGAYYLVESQAPLGYDVTESILFILNQDGTLSDKDGNLIGDGSKLVMHDKLIEQVPTGDILVGLVAFLGILGLAFGSYYYYDNNKKINDNKKVSA